MLKAGIECYFVPSILYNDQSTSAVLYALVLQFTYAILCCIQLKYVSKLKAHFVKMVNIFRNFYGIRDFNFVMHSYDDEDNFPL